MDLEAGKKPDEKKAEIEDFSPKLENIASTFKTSLWPKIADLKKISESVDSPSEASTVDNWSDDVEGVLHDIRSNCDIMSKHHKDAYLKLQNSLVYFRVPLIVLSALNSVFSVGLNAYLKQQTVSTINCLVSLICACISSIELFLQIQKKLEVELSSYQGFYLLGSKISATLKLSRAHRDQEGIPFLNSCISDYNNLFEQAIVNGASYEDQLVAIMNPNKQLATKKSSNPLRLLSKMSSLTSPSGSGTASPRSEVYNTRL
jgi:hypothetical protein